MMPSETEGIVRWATFDTLWPPGTYDDQVMSTSQESLLLLKMAKSVHIPRMVTRPSNVKLLYFQQKGFILKVLGGTMF